MSILNVQLKCPYEKRALKEMQEDMPALAQDTTDEDVAVRSRWIYIHRRV